jgi:hypothetical protein
MYQNVNKLVFDFHTKYCFTITDCKQATVEKNGSGNWPMSNIKVQQN